MVGVWCWGWGVVCGGVGSWCGVVGSGVEGMWGVGVVWWGVVLRECGE